jgi:hypothetical protein
MIGLLQSRSRSGGSSPALSLSVAGCGWHKTSVEAERRAPMKRAVTVMFALAILTAASLLPAAASASGQNYPLWHQYDCLDGHPYSGSLVLEQDRYRYSRSGFLMSGDVRRGNFTSVPARRRGDFILRFISGLFRNAKGYVFRPRMQSGATIFRVKLRGPNGQLLADCDDVEFP